MPVPTHATPAHDRILDDVFLTPRVVDEAAFRGFAESLRALIRDAESRGESLSGASADTLRLCETMREAARVLQERLGKGARVTEALAQQTTRAETLIDRLASAISNDRELERLADQVIEKRRAGFEGRVSAVIDGMLSRSDRASARAAQIEERVRLAEARVEAAAAGAAAFEARIAEVTARVHGATTEAEEAVERLTASLNEAVARAQREHARLDEATARSAQQVRQAGVIALDQAERDVDALRRAAAEAVSSTQETTDRAVGAALDALEQLRVLAQDLTASTEADAGALEARFGPLRDLVEASNGLLGTDEAPGALAAAISAASRQVERLEGLAPAVAREIEEAASAREALRADLDGAAGRLQEMDTRRTELCEALEREIEALGGDLSPIERAAAGLRLRFDQLEQRARALAAAVPTEDPDAAAMAEKSLDALRASADEVTAAALQRVEEAGMWLVKLIQRAESLAETGSGRGRAHHDRSDPAPSSSSGEAGE